MSILRNRGGALKAPPPRPWGAPKNPGLNRVKALEKHGVPRSVIGMIEDLYSNAETQIRTPKGNTRYIRINAGVKQGCPLSPLLFNLVMNKLVLKIQEMQNGEQMGGQRVGVMAFADDLIVLSNSSWEMDRSLKCCEEFFDGKGLKANAKKCLSLRILPVKGKRSMKVVTTDHRYWKGIPIPTMDYDHLAKYLGVRIDPEGSIKLPMEKWSGWFENLRKTEMKPEQRIYAL